VIWLAKLNLSRINKTAFQIATMLVWSDMRPGEQIIALSKALAVLKETHKFISRIRQVADPAINE
jgi:hypothetical protein